MTEYTPTVVAMYNLGNRENLPIAEYRLSADGRAELIILNQEQAYAPQMLYEEGVEIFAERRYVLPDEGPAFMRALLLPSSSSSYIQLHDKSPQSGE
ncbi:hypothetical protein ACFWF7_03720 [Nocardia sp. NPDC060256]|uniref:hypothetical protein n=1 Tax=unclassified Nocardia TaxID=2637762 RepID=UPI0036531A7C